MRGSKCGEVTDSTAVVNFYTGRSKVFGFVTFKEKENAKKAIAEMNGHEVKGRKLKVRSAKPEEKKKDKTEKSFDEGVEEGKENNEK